MKTNDKEKYSAYSLLKAIVEEKNPDGTKSQVHLVEPSILYPTTLRRIMSVIEGDTNLSEFFNLTEPYNVEDVKAQTQRAETYLTSAKMLSVEDCKLGFLHLDEIKDVETLKKRAQVLELARKWFTAALKTEIGGSINLRILRDEHFRLYPRV